MLDKCRRNQWSTDDLDWTQPPREMSRADEEAVVQYFTNMAGIELLAGALFREQRERATNPTLREIFDSFVKDEQRHSEVATRLAKYYDVHGCAVGFPPPINLGSVHTFCGTVWAFLQADPVPVVHLNSENVSAQT